MHRVEFTIEPFVEGNPGPHVTAPAEALRERGIDVEIGPFGTSCAITDADTPAIVAAIVEAALRNGADRISVAISTEGLDR